MYEKIIKKLADIEQQVADYNDNIIPLDLTIIDDDISSLENEIQFEIDTCQENQLNLLKGLMTRLKNARIDLDLPDLDAERNMMFPNDEDD